MKIGLWALVVSAQAVLLVAGEPRSEHPGDAIDPLSMPSSFVQQAQQLDRTRLSQQATVPRIAAKSQAFHRATSSGVHAPLPAPPAPSVSAPAASPSRIGQDVAPWTSYARPVRVDEGLFAESPTPSFRYGWFGVPPRQHWTRHFGYYRNYTQWSAK